VKAPAAPARGIGRSIAALLWRPFRFVLLLFAIVVIFVEEWGWVPLTALAAAIARWPPLAALERKIENAPRRVALLLFIVQALPLVPIKLFALWLIHGGHSTLGVAIIVAAKVVGTAVVGRLFMLVESQLMSFPWFARCVGWWRETRDRVKAIVQASLAWRAAQRAAAVGQRWLRRLLAWGSRL
jgi:hypothetical protein